MQYFLGIEKPWWKPTCGKLKILKPVHSISEFQNGRFVLPTQITKAGRLHIQAGYKRCLFFNSTASVIKEEGPAPRIFTENTSVCTEDECVFTTRCWKFRVNVRIFVPKVWWKFTKITKLLGLTASTNQAVLPTQINFRNLQHQQMTALRATQCYQATVYVNSNS